MFGLTRIRQRAGSAAFPSLPVPRPPIRAIGRSPRANALGPADFSARLSLEPEYQQCPVAANSAAIISHIGSIDPGSSRLGRRQSLQRRQPFVRHSLQRRSRQYAPPRSMSSSTIIPAKATSWRCRFRPAPSSRAITRTARTPMAEATTAASAAIRTLSSGTRTATSPMSFMA